MTTPTILSVEELAECAKLYAGTLADSNQHAALLGARTALSGFRDNSRAILRIGGAVLLERIEHFRDTRYPLPVREVPRTVRIAGDDLQVRYGRLWMLKGSGWRPCETTVDELVRAFLNQNNYADAALLCDLAANPTTTEGK